MPCGEFLVDDSHVVNQIPVFFSQQLLENLLIKRLSKRRLSLVIP